MSVQVNDIKIFMLISGLEIIGRIGSINDEFYEISQAYAMRYDAHQDEAGRPAIHVGMSPVSIMVQQESKTGAKDITIYKSAILFAIDPPESLLTQYASQTGSIIAPPSKKIQVPR